MGGCPLPEAKEKAMKNLDLDRKSEKICVLRFVPFFFKQPHRIHREIVV